MADTTREPVTLQESALLAVWAEFLQSAARRFNETVVTLWFEEAVPISLVQNNFFLFVETDFKRNTIDFRYRKDVESFFSAAVGAPVSLFLYSLPQAQKMPYFAKNESYLRTRSTDLFWSLFPSMLLLSIEGKEEGRKAPVPKEEYHVPKEVAQMPDFSFTSKEGVTTAPTEQKTQSTSFSFSSPVFAEPAPVTEPPSPVLTTQKENPPSVPLDLPHKDSFDFDHFIVGNSNRLAYAAAQAVAREPAKDYNPLFIWGPSGLGKTHLLKAIMYRLGQNYPSLKMKYVKGEEFTNQMVESLSYNRTEQFRAEYRQLDVLLIDDIQFIAGKEGTQEEFFHTFNALYENQKQIILTSDRPPKEMMRLEERLRTRFEWGMIADIAPPDLELRIAILKKKAELSSLTLPPEILSYVAQNLSNNVRQLEGAVKKLYAHAVLLGNPLTMETAISCIADLMTGSEPTYLTVDKILNKVCQKYEVTQDALKGNRRVKQIVNARHVAIYLIRTLTDMSFPQIGRLFGKDHATVMSSYHKICEDIQKENPFALEVKELQRSLQE